MPRQRPPDSPRVVHRPAHVALRTTTAQRQRCCDLRRSGGDVWAGVLELSAIRRQRGAAPLVTYQELCRELSADGPGTFGELSTVGARSILRRYSDAWMTAAKKRRAGEMTARYPRRKKGLVPSRYYAGSRGCRLRAHRDLVGALNIASRSPRGGIDVDPTRLAITDRRAGRHLPGRTRRDLRRVTLEQRGQFVGLGPAAARLGIVENGDPRESLARDASAA